MVVIIVPVVPWWSGNYNARGKIYRCEYDASKHQQFLLHISYYFSLALLFQIKCQFTLITFDNYKTKPLKIGLTQYSAGFSITNNTSIFAPLNNQ